MNIRLGSKTYKDVSVDYCYYGNGRRAIRIESDEGPIAVASVNLDDNVPCEENEVYIKEWSENAGMTAWLIANKIIKPEILGSEKTGFVTAHRYELTDEALADALKQTA